MDVTMRRSTPKMARTKTQMLGKPDGVDTDSSVHILT